MMNKWFECKVKYVKTMENGLEKPVTETYLVDALSFTEAEKRFLEEIRPFMSGEFEVTSIKPVKFADVFFCDLESADRWFKCKLVYITVDEKSGEEECLARPRTSSRPARSHQVPRPADEGYHR